MPSAPPANAPPETILQMVSWQIALEKLHFSCGTIDGVNGSRNRKALEFFQQSRGLPITGEFDATIRQALSPAPAPLKEYVVLSEDLAKIAPPPKTWKAMAQAGYLGYRDVWEMLAEKFHTTRDFLKSQNPNRSIVSAGDAILVPNIPVSLRLPAIDHITILLSETTVLLYHNFSELVGCFPCSIATNVEKRPIGALTITECIPNPDYTFDPKLFPASAQREHIRHRLLIPPGPNNPVGLAWIGLDRSGYGIHGTPDPTAISRTGSHGCFRLANWNAQMLVKSVHPGVMVEVLP